MEVIVSGRKSKTLAYLMEVSRRGHSTPTSHDASFSGSVSERDTLGEEGLNVQSSA